MKKQKLMTEQQFIAMFEKKGFALYKIKGIKKVYSTLSKIKRAASKIV